MPNKKGLTKQPKVYYNSSNTYRHCDRVIAFWDDEGNCFIQCRKCGDWVKIKKNK